MRGEGRKRSARLSAVICLVTLIVALAHAAGESPKASSGSSAPISLPSEDMLSSIPADYFIENKGQLNNQDILFYSTSGNMQLGFEESAVLIKIVERESATTAKLRTDWRLKRLLPQEPEPSRGVLLRLNFEGANNVTPQGRDPLPFPTNFFLGNDPTRWRTGVHSYEEIVYEDLYEGIDLVYHIGQDGLKYDFLADSRGDPVSIRMTYEGIESLNIDSDGLILSTTAGKLRDGGLVAMSGGDSVDCEFTRVSVKAVGFACEGWNRMHPLVIDPLLWATYTGGIGDEGADSVVVGGLDNLIVAGSTSSADFPVTPGAYDIMLGSSICNAFVMSMSPVDTTILWATYLGGDTRTEALALAVEGSGSVVVAGFTTSADFPATPGAYDVSYNGGKDAFVAKLSANGSTLLWATFLGGNDTDESDAFAFAPSGNVVVTGYTYSADFPVTPGAYDVTYNGWDAFVANLSADGSALLWATYLGGGSVDGVSAVVLDSSGNLILTGTTNSDDFPTTPGTYEPTHIGGDDAFVSKLSSNGSTLLWSTFLGGTDGDASFGLALNDSGNPVVGGLTISADFPATPGAYDVTWNGGFQMADVFVAKLSTDGSALFWATYVGGSGWDAAISPLVLDGSDNPIVAGLTTSTDFPATPGAIDVTYNGGFEDAIVAKLSANGSSLLWATYLGGASFDVARALTLYTSGEAVVAGLTGSDDFPVTPGAFDRTHNGGEDVFVAMLNLTLDLTPPVVTIVSPTDGTWVNATTLRVSGYSWDTGNGVDRVETSCDNGSTWSIAIGTGNWLYDCIGLVEGPNVIHARAFDLAGWESVNENVTVNVDLTPPTVGISSPANGTWISTTSVSVIGTASDSGSGLDHVEVSCDNGATWNMATGSYAWTFFCTGLIAGVNVIHARAFDLVGWESIHKSIKVNVGLAAPTVDILSPASGETWIRGSPHTVTWTAIDSEEASSGLLVWINYTSSAGSGNICGPVAGDIGSCSWTLPMITATDVVVNATVIDSGGLKGYDDSGPFTIRAPPNTPPQVAIMFPLGGEVLDKGSHQTVTWNMHDSEDPYTNLTIYLNYTTGGTTHQMAAALKGNSSFSWTLPDVDASDVIINITVIDTGGLKNWSQSGPFTISGPPSPPPSSDIISQYWWLIMVIVAVVIVLSLVLLLKKKKEEEKEGEQLPPSKEKEPPQRE